MMTLSLSAGGSDRWERVGSVGQFFEQSVQFVHKLGWMFLSISPVSIYFCPTILGNSFFPAFFTPIPQPRLKAVIDSGKQQDRIVENR
jgi:hypothetical protein